MLQLMQCKTTAVVKRLYFVAINLRPTEMKLAALFVLSSFAGYGLLSAISYMVM